MIWIFLVYLSVILCSQTPSLLFQSTLPIHQIIPINQKIIYTLPNSSSLYLYDLNLKTNQEWNMSSQVLQISSSQDSIWVLLKNELRVYSSVNFLLTSQISINQSSILLTTDYYRGAWQDDTGGIYSFCLSGCLFNQQFQYLMTSENLFTQLLLNETILYMAQDQQITIFDIQMNQTSGSITVPAKILQMEKSGGSLYILTSKTIYKWQNDKISTIRLYNDDSEGRLLVNDTFLYCQRKSNIDQISTNNDQLLNQFSFQIQINDIAYYSELLYLIDNTTIYTFNTTSQPPSIQQMVDAGWSPLSIFLFILVFCSQCCAGIFLVFRGLCCPCLFPQNDPSNENYSVSRSKLDLVLRKPSSPALNSSRSVPVLATVPDSAVSGSVAPEMITAETPSSEVFLKSTPQLEEENQSRSNSDVELVH